METLRDAGGREFTPRVLMQDGVKCATCSRVIRVREKAACYIVMVERNDGVMVPTVGDAARCRDCLYAEPINHNNRPWRKDAKREDECPKG